MEKLLLWIVLIIGAIIYEQIKERVKKKPSATAGQTRRTVAARPRAPRPAPAPAPEPIRPEATVSHHEKPRESRHTPLVIPTPKEDNMEDDKATAAETMRAYEEEQKAREAHYARWRQAIIDTQIIERKF